MGACSPWCHHDEDRPSPTSNPFVLRSPSGLPPSGGGVSHPRGSPQPAVGPCTGCRWREETRQRRGGGGGSAAAAAAEASSAPPAPGDGVAVGPPTGVTLQRCHRAPLALCLNLIRIPGLGWCKGMGVGVSHGYGVGGCHPVATPRSPGAHPRVSSSWHPSRFGQPTLAVPPGGCFPLPTHPPLHPGTPFMGPLVLGGGCGQAGAPK